MEMQMLVVRRAKGGSKLCRRGKGEWGANL